MQVTNRRQPKKKKRGQKKGKWDPNRRRWPSVVEQRMQHVISRQPIKVHGVAAVERGKSRVIGGRVVQNPVELVVRQEGRPDGRPGPAPRPEPQRPLVDFTGLEREIQRVIQQAGRRVGLQPIADAKFKSKWKYVKEKKLFGGDAKEGWGILHPFRTLGKLLDFRSSGRTAYRRDTRKVEAIRSLRREFKLEDKYNQAAQAFEATLQAELARIRQAVESGQANANNIRNYMESYRKAVRNARNAFNARITEIDLEYSRALVKAGLKPKYKRS